MEDVLRHVWCWTAARCQVCLVELSHLTRALGQACAALKDTLAASLSALLGHPSYGVRFEAAVALASLGSALPWCAAGLLQQCLDEIQQQYDALIVEGILPSSMPSPVPAGSSAPGKGSGVVSSATAAATTGDAAHGEADADLELDGDGGAGGATRVSAGGVAVGGSDGNAVVAGDDGLSVQGVGGKGIGVGGDVRRVGARGRSPMVNKRQRLLLLHGNSAAASFLMQVARELPMGIPSKVAENSFAAAEKLILVQFPEPYRPRPPPHHPPPSRSRAQPQTRAETQTQSQARARMEMEKDIDEDEDTAEAAMSKSEFSVSARSRRRGGWGRPAPAKPAESYDPEPPSDATKGGGASAPDTAADGKAEGSGDLRGGMGGDAAADDDDDDDDDDEDEEEGEGGYGGTSLGQQHPIGVVCTCVRTGWSLMSSLFCVGEEWAEAHAPRLMELWALCMRGVNEGPVATRLRGLEPAHELILLDASTRALLWFLRSCPKTLCMVPERLSLALVLMESSVEAVEGRLKNPVKKQGVICRTLLKALLMECFAWLPPRSFPQSSARLFKWALDHLKMYTLNDVQSSLLPELLHPDDAVLSVSSTAKVPTISGVGSVVEGEDSDRVLAQVALISGVTIGPQERDAMVCSAELWAGRGPSPARRRRALENHPPTRLHASPEVQNPGSSASDLSAASASGAAAGAGAGGGWRRPLPSLASINVRLLDAAVQVFGACFGEQSEQVKLEGISGLLQALPDNLQHAAAAATTATTIRVAVRRESAVKDASFSMPVLLSDEDRKRRERRHRLSVLNVCSALLAALKSMPPLPEAGDGASGSPARHNIDLPWVVRTRDLLLELLSSGDSMIRRAAAESLALMGLKVGDGYAVYLVQDLLNILRKPNDKKSKTIDRDFPVNAYRRAGAIFTLACLKRTMGGQVVLNWFWADVQRELSVGGDVVQPVRIWGLHAIGVLVKGLDAESNPTQYSEIQEMVKYLDGVVELLEAHFLGSWTSSTVPGSKRVAGASVSSSALLKDNQTVCADVPGLASVLAKLLCTLLPVLQALRPSRALVNRFLAMWSVLRNEADCRVTHWCLELVELLAMFAPGEVPEALPEIMPFVQGVLRSGVGGASPECLVRAAMCVKLVAARAPEAVEGYKPELELYSCLESVLGSLTWEGAPTWRGVVVSRDVERHFGVRVDAARQLEAAIETVVRVDQGGYRPVHWLLFGKALVVGTGHVQHQGAASSVAGGGGGVLHGDGDGDGAAGRGLEKNEASDWQGVVQAARNSLAMFASPLASSRWQVKRSAVRGCVMVLVALHNESAHTGDERVSCLDVNKARKAVNRAIRTLTSEGSPDSEAALTILPPRPIWARVPTLLCLYLEDLVTLACAASTASTDDSELLELQEAGVMMLTEVARTFAQVPDSDEDEMRVVSVAGRSIRASSLALELAISQITAATRPALGCKVSPRLAQKGCELVVTLVREGLVKDTVVLRRLVRQVMPEQILALSAKQSGLEKSRRRTRASRSPSPKPSPPYSTTSSPRELAGGMVTPRERRYSPTPDDMATMVAAAKVSPGTEGESSPGSLNSTSASAAAAAAAAASVEASIHAAVKESLRPRVSEVYGVHVPLAERSARLQCLAVLSLVAWGEDDPKDGGGSGSGAIIPDSVRRGLLEALREHLTVLGLHWLASVKDAVRLNQGDASAMWPRYKKRNLGAGLTYPPGVKPSFAKSQLKGRWPVMAAAAAAELTRVDAAASVTVGAARTAAVGCKPEEAARFLLCVSMGGLLEARDGLSRRRLDAPGRSPFSRGLEYASVDLGGDGSGSEEEEDEGHVAEQASHMFLVTIRCLLSKPELLGDPAAPTQHASTGESLSTRCERRRQGKGKGEGLGELDLPSTALVDVIRTLSSFPFLHTGGKADAVGGSVKEGGIPEHLQLAAVSVLRALVSGEGAKFIISSGERWQDPPGVRQAALEEREELEGGDDDAEEVEDDEEGEEWETGPFGLWEAAVRAVIGAVRAVLPQAFDSFVPAGADVKDHPPSSKVISVITATAGTPSGGPEDASSAVVAASAAASTKLHSTVMTASTVPLLHLLPNLTPAPERPTALPALLLLSIRVLGAVSAAMPSVGEKGESKMSPMPAVSHGAEALAGTAPGVSPLTAEGTGAVNFVRECVREVCVHGDASRVSESVGGVGGVEIPGAGDTSRLNGSVLTGRGGGGEVVSTESSNGVASAEVKSAVANGAVAPVVDEEEEDDWGDEDFQQADEATLTTCTAAAPVDEQSAGEEGRTLPGAGSDDAADGDGVEGTGDRHEGGGVDEELEGAGSGRSGEGSAAEEKGQPTGDDKARSQMPGNEGDAREDSTAVDDLDDSSRSENQGRGHPEDEDVGSTEREVLGEAVHAPGTELHSGGETAPKLVVEGQCTTGPVSITGGHGSSGDSALDDPQKADQPVELDRDAAVGARDDLDSDVAGQTDQISAAAGDGAGADTSTLVMNSTKLVQGAGRAVNALLESIMNGSAQETCAASISVVAEAWGAIALVAPREAEGLAGPLQEALASPVERCSVSSRLALFRGVSVSFQAVAEEGEKGSGPVDSTPAAAAGTLMRLLAPYALAGLRMEVKRAADAAGAFKATASAGTGFVAGGGDEGAREAELTGALLVEGVHVAQLSFKAAPQASHSALLGLLLPLYASALTLNLPPVSAAIGQALLYAARSSAGAFKEAVAYLGPGDRQGLEGAVRAAMMGKGNPGAGVAGSGSGMRGKGVGGSMGGTGMSGRKLDLSQYKSRS